jgi:hypothetical protein
VSRPAVAALEDARERAGALLWPPDAGRWLRLVVLTAFVGGAGSAGSAGGNLQSSVPATGGGGAGVVPGLPAFEFGPSALPTPEVLVRWVAVVVGLLLVAALVYALVGAVAEFALVGALRDGTVGLRASARRYAAPGVRLFAFRVAVVAAALVVGGGPLALAAWGALTTDPALGLLAVPALLFAAVVALAAWLVLTLTTDLVVPAVLASGVRGPVGGWRRVAPVVAANPLDVGLYLLVRVVLGVATGVVVGLVGGLVALVVGVPFAVAAAAALAAAGAALSLAEVGTLVALAVLFALVTGALLQVVRTPVVLYLRAYAVATLGRLSADLALFAGTDGAESPALD